MNMALRLALSLPEFIMCPRQPSILWQMLLYVRSPICREIQSLYATLPHPPIT